MVLRGRGDACRSPPCLASGSASSTEAPNDTWSPFLVPLAISLGDIRDMPTRSKFTFCSGFSQFFVQCTKISFRRGVWHKLCSGVCVYSLKSVRKGKEISEMYGLGVGGGVGGRIFEH